MDVATHPGDPRKQVRICLRRDLEITPQVRAGRRQYVIKDPVRLRYFCFDAQEYFILQRLNGAHTLDEVRLQFEQAHRPRRLRSEEIEGFARQLVVGGLAHDDTPAAGRRLLKRRRVVDRGQRRAVLSNPLVLQIPLGDPDRFLGFLLRYTRWIFTKGFVAFSILLMVAAAWLVVTHFHAFRHKLPSAAEFFQFHTLFALWLGLAVVKVIHELGHGLSCKVFGGEVHEFGIMFLCFAPCLYCDVSDAWMLPSRRQRMLISFAGMYVELTIAALATFAWWYSPGTSFGHHLALALMTVCSINTLLLNGNPLLRYDGYYVLSDWLEVPNLSDQSRQLLYGTLASCCLGIQRPWRTFYGPLLHCGLLLYAAASTAYRWLVVFGVLWFLQRFLKGYRLEPFAQLLAVWVLAVMAGRSLYLLVQSLRKREGRLPMMSPYRILITGVVLGALVVAFFQVPLPVSRIRTIGLVQFQPDAAENVFVQTPGVLQRLLVREGQHVGPGELLAEFRSLDLESQRAGLQAKHDIRHAELLALRQQDPNGRNAAERGRLEVRRAHLSTEGPGLDREMGVFSKMHQQLELRAPRAGVVAGLPRREEIGRSWDKDAGTPLCTVGDPTQLWIIVPLVAADYRLVREDMNAARDLAVRVHVHGLAGRTLEGTVAQLPESEAEAVPAPLTHRAGGPVAVRPGSDAPQGRWYLVAVALNAPAETVLPGMTVAVRLDTRWRTAAWRVQRFLAETLRLDLCP